MIRDDPTEMKSKLLAGKTTSRLSEGEKWAPPSKLTFSSSMARYTVWKLELLLFLEGANEEQSNQCHSKRFWNVCETYLKLLVENVVISIRIPQIWKFFSDSSHTANVKYNLEHARQTYTQKDRKSKLQYMHTNRQTYYIMIAIPDDSCPSTNDESPIDSYKPNKNP